jgi:hypothetical protein
MALFDIASMLMGGMQNPDLLAQQMAGMGMAVPPPGAVQQATQQLGGGGQNFNNIMNPSSAGGRGQQMAGLAIGPGGLGGAQPQMLQPPGAAVPQPAPPPSGRAAVPGAPVPVAQPTIMPPSVVPPPAPPPVSPPMGQGGIGSDFAAAPPAAAPMTTPAGAPTPATTQTLSQRLLGTLAGVKAPSAPQAQVPYPPAAPRPSGQIQPGNLADLLMKASQVAQVPSLAQRLGR